MDAMTEDARWGALVRRDADFEPAFVYGVSSTGIYCRPACPSRLPRPENVRFFETGAEAVKAGFRACKRCRPDQAEALHADRLNAICREIKAAETPLSLKVLAKRADLSPYHFHRLFKAHTGLTPAAYGRAMRGARLRESLKTSGSVTEALYEAGFNAPSRLYAQADAALGMTPSAYRAGGVKEEIRFAVGQCRFGAVLVAQSGRGVCTIALGDDADVLIRGLQDDFPQAHLIGGDAGFETHVAQVVGLIEDGQGFDLPLDIRGTVFQQRVWQALRAIPAGTRLSYAQVAEAIGAPSAVRAVASACGANRLAVAIPCHRVVRSDGSLSGYRWGVARKEALLAGEQKSR